MKENIPGYPGYHITKDGKVYTHKSGGWKLRKTSNSSSTGRIRVRINSKWLQVSRLVALAWVKTLSRLNETQKLLGLKISYYNIQT